MTFLFYVMGKSWRICRSSRLRASYWVHTCRWFSTKLFKSLLFDSAQFLGACFRFAHFCLFGLKGNFRYFSQTSQWLSRNLHICSAHFIRTTCTRKLLHMYSIWPAMQAIMVSRQQRNARSWFEAWIMKTWLNRGKIPEMMQLQQVQLSA